MAGQNTKEAWPRLVGDAASQATLGISFLFAAMTAGIGSC